MAGKYAKLFNYYHKRVAAYGGDVFSVYRPDYTIPDNEPVLIHSNILVRVDPTGNTYEEPAFRGLHNYDLFCNRKLIQSGDILKKEIDDDFSPIVTVASIFPVKATNGIRTSRKGKITSGPTTILYDNVYFDFLDNGRLQGTINSGLTDSERVPSVEVAIYFRENIVNFEGLVLVEMDRLIPEKNHGKKWIIEQVTASKPFMILTMRNFK